MAVLAADSAFHIMDGNFDGPLTFIQEMMCASTAYRMEASEWQALLRGFHYRFVLKLSPGRNCLLRRSRCD